MNTLFKTVTKSHDKKSVLSFQNHQSIEHKILIEELELSMFIGVLPEEKTSKQRVIIDLEISLEPKSNYGDDIANTVSYADVIDGVEKLAASKHFCLVETLAEEIVTECFKKPLVNKVTVSIKKPDIIKQAKAVGFSMAQTKEVMT